MQNLMSQTPTNELLRLPAVLDCVEDAGPTPSGGLSNSESQNRRLSIPCRLLPVRTLVEMLGISKQVHSEYCFAPKVDTIRETEPSFWGAFEEGHYGVRLFGAWSPLA